MLNAQQAQTAVETINSQQTQEGARYVRVESLETLGKALQEFARSFGPEYGRYLADDVAAKLSCNEVEALTGLLRALGDDATADVWLSVHAADDEPDEMHGTPED